MRYFVKKSVILEHDSHFPHLCQQSLHAELLSDSVLTLFVKVVEHHTPFQFFLITHSNAFINARSARLDRAAYLSNEEPAVIRPIKSNLFIGGQVRDFHFVSEVVQVLERILSLIFVLVPLAFLALPTEQTIELGLLYYVQGRDSLQNIAVSSERSQNY